MVSSLTEVPSLFLHKVFLLQILVGNMVYPIVEQGLVVPFFRRNQSTTQVGVDSRNSLFHSYFLLFQHQYHKTQHKVLFDCFLQDNIIHSGTLLCNSKNQVLRRVVSLSTFLHLILNLLVEFSLELESLNSLL